MMMMIWIVRTVKTHRYMRVFRINILFKSSGLKLETLFPRSPLGYLVVMVAADTLKPW